MGPHLPPRYGATEVRLVSKVLIDEVVLTAHQHPTRTITPSWNYSGRRGHSEAPTN